MIKCPWTLKSYKTKKVDFIMIKLVVSDVDGTLVPDGTFDIDTGIYDVINELDKLGITFVAASGRQYASLRRLFEPVKDKIMYITDNGGFVRDKDGEIWQKNPMEHKLVNQLTVDARKIPGINVMLCGRDYAYVSDEDSYVYKWLRDSYRFDLKAPKDLTKIEDDIVKVSIYHPTDAETVVKEWFYDKWKDKTLIASAGPMWMDCIREDINKGTALKFIMDKLGVTSDEVMVFGDNINDLEMLELSNHSYAIGSAREEVKMKAKYVADTMSNQGVIKTIREKILKM